MRFSANEFSPDREKVVLCEEVKPATRLYTVLLLFISLALYSVFWRVPVPHPYFRIGLVAVGSVIFFAMIYAAVFRTAGSYTYVLTDDKLLIYRRIFRKNKLYFNTLLAEIRKMDRLSAGLPRGRVKSACVVRLSASPNSIYLMLPHVILLMQPSEHFARTLSRAAARSKGA